MTWNQTECDEIAPLNDQETVIDVTSQVCPMTYVYTKLALENLSSGQVLTVFLRGPEPVQNVPRSAREEGHEVILLEGLESGMHRLLIRKK